MTSKNEYDVIVVGAGPAGTTAARYAAEGGASVLVLEKDRDVGYPVRCGEAVSHDGLVQFIQPDPKFIASTITKFRFFAPNGKSVTPKIDGVGYVLERRIFDYELGKIAAQKGAEIVTKAYVFDLLRGENGRVTGVKALIKDQPVDIKSSVVIGADGVESRIGRWAEIDTTCHLHDMESCAQVTLGGITTEQDTLDFYLGDEYAPGGYLWVFPKGPNTANVGLGVAADKVRSKKNAIHYLENFLKGHYAGAARLTHIAGGCPCAVSLDNLVKNNVMLVGDAGRQVNPVSGGGIISGMIGGMLAGQIAAEAIKSGNLDHLTEYQRRWDKRLGWRHKAFYNIKEGMDTFTDETLNKICDGILKVPPEKRTLGALFRTAMWNKPSLLLEVAKVFLN